MSGGGQAAEAHRLKNECGYGSRRIAKALGISRYAAEQLLTRPLPRPVADQVPDRVAEVADVVRPVAVRAAAPVGHPAPGPAEVAVREQPAADQAAEAPEVVDGMDVRPPGPWLGLDLSRRPQLWRALRFLLHVGVAAPVVVEVAVRAFAAAYYQAVTRGELRPGEAYQVQTRVRPAQPRQRAA